MGTGLYDYDEKPWVVSQTVASWISVLGVAFALWAIVQERIQRVRSRDDARIATDPVKMDYFYVKRASWLATFLGGSTDPPQLTTIRGLIEAGDNGLWTSAAIDQVRRSWHDEICWVPLYRSIFKMVAEGEGLPGEMEFTPVVKEYINRAREDVRNEKLRHAEKMAEWEELKLHINSEIEPPDGLPVVLEQLKQDVQSLGERHVPPLRSQLYEGMPEGVIAAAPSISRLASFPALETLFQSGLSYVRGKSDAEKTPEASDDTPVEARLRQPLLVRCMRSLEQPKVVSHSPAVRPHFSRARSTGMIPGRAKLTRFHSSTTIHSVSSSISSKVQLNEIGRQFNKWLGSSALSLDHPGSGGRVPTSEDFLPEDVMFRQLNSGLNDTRSSWMLNGRACIEVSRESLAALALILGIRLTVNDFSSSISGFGAFGASLYVSQSGGYWKLTLQFSSRAPSHGHSQGSGYTTLMAKHIACGSIPFANSIVRVQSIYVTSSVLKAIREGRHIKDSEEFGGSSLEYLRRLPSAKQVDAFYGTTKEPADLLGAKMKRELRGKESGSRASLSFDLPPMHTPSTSAQKHPLGVILDACGSPVGSNCTWPRAVVGIAFGGLVPQAAPNLVSAVRFTISGSTGSCVTALEELINKLHGLAKESEAFGPYVAHRARYGVTVENVDYCVPVRSHPREAAARFSRYANLIERLVACCDVPNPLDAVFEASCELLENTYLSAVLQDGKYSDDLGLAVKNVTSALRRNVRVKECAVIVRCVLAAWAEQVPFVELVEEGRGSEEGVEGVQWCRANRQATLEDLPAVSAIG